MPAVTGVLAVAVGVLWVATTPQPQHADPERIAALERELGISPALSEGPTVAMVAAVVRGGARGVALVAEGGPETIGPPRSAAQFFRDVTTTVHYSDGGRGDLTAEERRALGPPDETGRYERPRP